MGGEAQKVKPQRIQRRRAKGWRMPDGAVYVGRPGGWGNPFRMGECYKRVLVGDVETYSVQIGRNVDGYERIVTRQQAVEWYRWYLSLHDASWLANHLKPLRGKNLACWCPLDQPCHADVLLEIANAR